MFGSFKNKKTNCPVPENTRLWIENSMIWLINEFGQETLLHFQTLEPSIECFPVKAGSKQIAYDVLAILAKQMGIEVANIVIDFYENPSLESRGDMGSTLRSKYYDNSGCPAGIYEGKNSDGKFSILLESTQLNYPDRLIATLAHELAHIKILGEGRLEQNDEYLTDLVTVFFGIGIFTANIAFYISSDYEKWEYFKQGYLSQQEWGYALAIYAYMRNELNPIWRKYLVLNIRADFAQGLQYILENKDKVLV